MEDFVGYKEQIKQLDNVIVTGYVTDEKLKSLMCECKALVFPSLYEGFGITPLEVISCGAEVIVSSATCLPEIYRNNVYYIDPYNYDVTIDEIYKQKIDDPSNLLRIYCWDKAANQLNDILRKV